MTPSFKSNRTNSSLPSIPSFYDRRPNFSNRRERPVGITALEDRLRELGSDYLLDWNNEGAEQMPGVLIDLTMDEPSSESGDHDDVEEETKIKESEQK